MTSTHFLSQDHLHTSLNPQDSQPSSSRFSSFDSSLLYLNGNLPASHPNEQYFLNPPTQSFNIGADYLPSTTSIHPYQMDWSNSHSQFGDYHRSDESYYCLSSSGPRNQEVLSAQGASDGSACPRTWSQMYDSRGQTREPFGFDGLPCEHRLETDNCPTLVSEWNHHNYTSGDGPRDFTRLSISRSPTMDTQITHASPAAFECKPTPLDTTFQPSRVSELGDDEVGGSLSGSEERVSDEPYAKLIYRALLSAPNHSMALQQIYQWFKDNTDKGSSVSSGWRNSIRHNLSMNAAFRKTDRRTLGEDSKKTSEWVLEPFAIKEGITPTTRYRVKNTKKSKSENPQRHRADAGRKGGLSARKRNYKQRSKDESNGRYRMSSMAETSRHISPSTPPAVQLYNSSPYFIQDPFSYADLEVNSVYPHDEGPVFCSNNGLPSRCGDGHDTHDMHTHVWPGFTQC